MDIKASEAVCGDFTFTCMGDTAMIIEKHSRNQTLTLEEGEAELLVDALPKVLKLFQSEFNRKCLNCWKYHGENKKFCPLKGNVGSDFYCKNFDQMRNKPPKEGEQE